MISPILIEALATLRDRIGRRLRPYRLGGRHNLLTLTAASVTGVIVRYAVEAALRLRTAPPSISDRLSWLLLVGCLALGGVVAFGLAARSLVGAAEVAVVLGLVATLAWQWQPAGVGFLSTMACIFLAVLGTTSEVRRWAVGAVLAALVISAAYSWVAQPETAMVVARVAPITVLVLAAGFVSLPRPHRFQLRLLWVSAVPFMIAAGMAGYISRDSGRISDTIPIADQSPSIPSAANSAMMAVEFAPVLVFAPHEQWRPVSIGDYIANARASDTRMPQKTTPLDGQPYRPDQYRFAGCTLDKPCYEISNPCIPSPASARCLTSQDSTGTYDLYRRVLDRPHYRSLFSGHLPFPDLQYMVQYWLFYPYDRWKSPEGLLVQQHSGDWEAVTVGLSKQRPLFVAYSAHCGGVWRRWQDVRAVAVNYHQQPQATIDWHTAGTNPVAWVAEGSHAMYPSDGDAIPKWSDCIVKLSGQPQVRSLLRIVLSGSARETMAHQTTSAAYVGRLWPAIEYWWLDFPGEWGPSDRTTLAGVPVSMGSGPLSPSCQPLWIDPIWSIFCNPHWSGPEDRCHSRTEVMRPNPCKGFFPTGPDTPVPTG
jgi:hypothetical protein